MWAKTYTNIIYEKLKETNSSQQSGSENSSAATEHLSLGGDARKEYSSKCIAERDLVLPILDKIRGKTLFLQSYTLSKGHCLALAQACKHFNDQIVNRVHFDNCGLDDTELSIVIEALSQLHDFKSIVYKQNEFGPQALEQIPKLFNRPIPFHLQELKLIDCKIQ